MFERYTEKARRTIFFARYEAAQHGSLYIEVPHLLLGLVREEFAVIQKVCTTESPVLAHAMEALCPHSGKTTPVTDLPLSESSKRVLMVAAEESRQLRHRHIGSEHLLMGVLRIGGAEAQILQECGIELQAVRDAFREPRPAAVAAAESGASLRNLSKLVTQIPPDRREAALRILSGLTSAYFSASGVSAEGPFSYTFGQPRESEGLQ